MKRDELFELLKKRVAEHAKDSEDLDVLSELEDISSFGEILSAYQDLAWDVHAAFLDVIDAVVEGETTSEDFRDMPSVDGWST